MELTLKTEQFEAIGRVRSSHPQQDAVKHVKIEQHTAYIRVTFDAGWGTYTFDVDEDGNSAPVNFGDSTISIEADGIGYYVCQRCAHTFLSSEPPDRCEHCHASPGDLAGPFGEIEHAEARSQSVLDAQTAGR